MTARGHDGRTRPAVSSNARQGRAEPHVDRGSAAVELAIVLPLLLLVLFGVIDFGRMLNTQITLTEAAREGARASALGLDPQARIDQTVNGLTIASTTVTSCPTDDLSADATIVLSHNFLPVTPVGSLLSYFGGQGDGTVTITAQGVMPCVG
ncbi:MAG TPA: TadE family protein [Actinoplanes sp.]|nr:TadE family protein [Actinoplanes sp.]